jgi:hypothetical protein|nr:MAG TPA: hypothetical protein [Caudoviricetes sp.]
MDELKNLKDGLIPEILKNVSKEDTAKALALVLGAMVTGSFLKIVNDFVNSKSNSSSQN